MVWAALFSWYCLAECLVWNGTQTFAQRINNCKFLHLLYFPPCPLLESSSESECESDEDSTCSSSSDSEVFDVIAEIKRKKAHPDRLHDELWYNDPGQVRMFLCCVLARRLQTHTSHLWLQAQKMHVGWYENWVLLSGLCVIPQSLFLFSFRAQHQSISTRAAVSWIMFDDVCKFRVREQDNGAASLKLQ